MPRPPSSTLFPYTTLFRSEIAGGDLLGRADEPRGSARQQEMKDEPHREREGRDPAGPVQRLLDDLRARFGLVALQIVGEKHAAGARWTELLALGAHQDVGVAKELDIVRVDRHSRATLAYGAQIELRKHVPDRLSEPCAFGRRDDDVAIVGHRGKEHVVVK